MRIFFKKYRIFDAMLNKLKQHWEVQTRELILILCTFAITGTVTAWLSKKVAEWLFLDKYGFAWWTSKIVMLIFGYQVIILIVGFCFGMFSFFWKYEKKILARFGFFKKEFAETVMAQPLVPDHPKKEFMDKIEALSPEIQKSTDLLENSSREIEKKNFLHGNLQNNAEKSKHDLPKLKSCIAIFASGAGSNAQKIIDHFRNSNETEIALIVCNKQKAGVLSIAENEGIPVLLLNKNKLLDTGYVEELQKEKIEVIVLAGFLWQIPAVLIRAFPNRIINIHPGLLPDYGGKGMYGNAVHEAVLGAQEKESGITIHFVDEIYDHGEIIFQATCSIEPNETIDGLKKKIHQLEHEHFPKEIEKIIKNLRENNVGGTTF